MPVLEQIKKRFVELEVKLKNIPIRSGNNVYAVVATADWQGWASSVMNLLSASFGEKSVHFKNFSEAYIKCRGNKDGFEAISSIFLAAKSDYEGGYIFSLESSLSGEILGDFVAMAKLALSENQKDVAAVLACAALEDTLKRYGRLNGVDVDDKDMSEVISALKAKGLVSGAQKSLLYPMPKIRNFALHAEFDKIDSAAVGSVIGYVENFLLTKFA